MTSSIVSSAADLPAGTSFPWIADGFAYGGDYGPEQWPEEVWQEDVALMARAGVNSVNLGVFSWGLIEIADGVDDFGWLDRIMALLHAHGVGVNLATPTAAPPIWLLQAHPEVAPVTEAGVRFSQGGRLGWYPCSATFRRYALRIVEKVSQRYGNHPALRMWHVSNELGNENHHSYDDETGVAWQLWLREKYGAVETLNDVWGSAFWGHHYTSFEQIQPPRYTGTGHNPALLLDFERFTSDALLGHYVRRHCSPGFEAGRLCSRYRADAVPSQRAQRRGHRRLCDKRWSRRHHGVLWHRDLAQSSAPRGIPRSVPGPARFEEIFPLIEHERVTLDNGWTGSVWSELGEATTAQVVASYTEGDLAGRPAVTRRTLPASGRGTAGTATYVSTMLSRASAGALIDYLLAPAGVGPVAAGDRGLERLRRTDGSRSWLFAINHAATPLSVTVTGLDLISDTRVEGLAVIPAGSVAVIREDNP